MTQDINRSSRAIPFFRMSSPLIDLRRHCVNLQLQHFVDLREAKAERDGRMRSLLYMEFAANMGAGACRLPRQ